MNQKKIITPILALALVIGVLACNSNDNSTGVEVRKENGNSFLFVDLDQAGDTIDFDISKIVDSCRLVKFENTTDALIKRVSGLALTDDKLYVYHQQKNLMVFDYQGKYHGIIGGQGQGPFEYTYINDLKVDQENDMLLIEPAHIDKYHLYGLDGEAIVSLPRNMDGSHIVSLIDFKINEIGYEKWVQGLSTIDDIAFVVQKTQGETLIHDSSIYKAIEVRVGGVALPLCGYPYKDEFKVFFSRDTLYSIDMETGALQPDAVFTASKNGFDYLAVEKDIRTGANTLANKINRVYTEVHAETDQYFLLRQMKYVDTEHGYQMAKGVSYFCVDKKKKSVHPVRLKDSFWGLSLDNYQSPMPFTKWEIIDNKYAVLTYHAIDLLDEIDLQLEDQSLDFQLKSKLNALKNGLSEEDNVVMFVYYLKT